MKISIYKLLTFPLIMLLTGCASVDNDVKVPPGSYTSHAVFTVPDYATIKSLVSTHSTEAKLQWLMPMVEISDSGFIHPKGIIDKHPESEDKTPLFLAYDISKLELGNFELLFPEDNEEERAKARNILIKRILYLSDKNFDTYTSRMQTFNDAENLSSKSLDTIGTATIGGTALIAPPAAAGIALTKLLTDSTYTNIQNSFLGGGTVEAVLKAMAANREKFKAYITNKLYTDGKNEASGPSTYENYPIIDVLGDIRELNRISTLHGALDDITQIATTQAQAAKATTDSINTNRKAEPPATLQSNLNATVAQVVPLPDKK